MKGLTDSVKGRLRFLNRLPVAGRGPVIYWMQAAQRVRENPALAYALAEANRRRLPLLVIFGLTAAYPEANLRHYVFMLQGLLEVRRQLEERGVGFILRFGSPPEVALEMAAGAALLVCDRGYLRHQRQWRRWLVERAECAVHEVEGELVVPLAAASGKAEYAARTLRPKINRRLESFLAQPSLPEDGALISSSAVDGAGEALKDEADLEKLLARLAPDPAVGRVDGFFPGGATAAEARLAGFLSRHLADYDRDSNQPQRVSISGLAPYLHFGQISALTIARRVKKAGDDEPEAAAAFLEQLIVRRELAFNFVYYCDNYDDYGCLPAWARKTLAEHAGDRREYLYSEAELAAAATHDPYWNAAMREMLVTGYMHNYMRMYWGKKVLEWSPDPQTGFKVLLQLNNRYFLDGRDANSYAGVAWVFGLHDRAWQERPIFGKIRYMAASGLERKCDIKAYVGRVDELVDQGRCRLYRQAGLFDLFA